MFGNHSGTPIVLGQYAGQTRLGVQCLVDPATDLLLFYVKVTILTSHMKNSDWNLDRNQIENIRGYISQNDLLF